MSTDRGMDKEGVVHMCNGILLGPENNEIMPFAATWRLLYSVKLVKTKIMYHLYVESRKKNDTNELIYKTDTDSQT